MELFFLLLLMVAKSNTEVVCYHCYGNSTDHGQLCSIDKLCLGESCYFRVEENGEWSAGCGEQGAPPILVCAANELERATSCYCGTDLCNQFKSANETLRTFWKNQTNLGNVTLQLPELSVNCIECGIVSIGGRDLKIPCAEKHICRGGYCIIKRGLNPHSYCGSIWEGVGEARCFKTPGEEEQCVCTNNMCNVMLSPEAAEAMMKSSTLSEERFTFGLTTDAIIALNTTAAATASTTAAATTATATTATTTASVSATTATGSGTTTTTTTTTGSGTTTITTTTARLISIPEPNQDPQPSESSMPTTTPSKTKRCRNTMKFSPNAQAVLMGQKLGQLISGGFGSSSNAVQEFAQGIDTHNCNYSA
ncbi:hypothetical protein RB195_000767 [Necator americanus]|uniref:DUF7741 domain-containing protein n=1 Tax=Necator americanus TaxID=51031 RepID=A0ABR1DBA0_NECAM